jgi:tryptophanyl-tRNA synthetase
MVKPLYFRSKIQEDMLIPGTNGGKMSKSAIILSIYSDDKSLRKQVMSIETDSTPLEDPKTDTCNALLFILYWLQRNKSAMKALYLGGNYGYGHAKQALYELKLSNRKRNTSTHEQPS